MPHPVMAHAPDSPDARAARVAERLARHWEVPDLAEWVRLEWSTRLRTSVARCRPKQGRIALARWLGEAETALLEEVVCHELAHVVVFERHGRRARPHGPEWGALVRSAGFEPRARLPLELGARSDRRPAVLYEHRCPVCQARRIARRRVPGWRCRACLITGLDGELEIRRLQSGGDAG